MKPSSSGSTSTSTDHAAELLAAWAATKAVDHHCHPLWRWPRQLTALELRQVFSEAVDPRIAAEHVPFAAAYRGALRRLGRELQCPPTEEGVLSVRRSGDPEAFANRLLERSGTGMLLVDHGFATDDTFTVAEHAAAIRIPQREVVRLEAVAESVLERCETPAEWFDAVRGALKQSVFRGAVGVKTVAAYRASLRLRPVDPDQVGIDFSMLRERARRGDPVRLTGDPLCHSLVFEAGSECRDLDVPLQVHCGFGDPDEDLAQASPLGLRLLLKDPRYAGLRLILLHCYPFHREAAYLCAVYPDVYMDLSLAIPLAAHDGARALDEALGLCPWSKLLYASDASRLPEIFFVAAALHREAIAESFGQRVASGALHGDEAVQAGRLILRDNAMRVYGLQA